MNYLMILFVFVNRYNFLIIEEREFIGIVIVKFFGIVFCVLLEFWNIFKICKLIMILLNDVWFF